MKITPPSFSEIWFLVEGGWQDFINTDFNLLKFSDANWAIKVGMIVVALVLLKLAWVLLCKIFGLDKYSRMDSGHTSSRDSERGFLAGFFLTLPKIILLAPLVAILFAVADPFLSIATEEKKYIETRTRIDLRDASGSMGEIFQGGKKSKAKVAMDAHLKFINMRRGKNDRTAFWLFSDEPYPVQEDFTIDDELLYLKVYDAPWEIGNMSSDMWADERWDNYPIPQSRYLYVAGQGGTQLSKTLKAAIQLFDSDEKKQKKTRYYKSGSRSILIVTDAAISDLETTKIDLEELRRRKITPYIIFIDEMAGEHNQQRLAAVSELLKEVTVRGGKFFPVSEEKAVENAYREIDRMETGKVEIERKIFRIPVFYKFIFLAIVCLIAVVPIGMLLELLSYP